MALDVGEARIGLAMSDPLGMIASPIGNFDRKSAGGLAALVARIREAGATALVIGLPLDLNGQEGPQARLVREFVARLDAALQANGMTLPMHFHDERFTTRIAQQARISGVMTKKKRRSTTDDAQAAAVLLQSWMDRERNRAQTSPRSAP
jgi:putative Holliday junction resolvase